MTKRVSGKFNEHRTLGTRDDGTESRGSPHVHVWRTREAKNWCLHGLWVWHLNNIIGFNIHHTKYKYRLSLYTTNSPGDYRSRYWFHILITDSNIIPEKFSSTKLFWSGSDNTPDGSTYQYLYLYLYIYTKVVSLTAEEFANRKPNDSGNLPLSLSQSFRNIDLAVEVVGCRWIATTPRANPFNGEDWEGRAQGATSLYCRLGI